MKKRRKVFNLYNLVVIVCIIVIAASLFVILNKEDNLPEGLKAQVNSIVTFVQDTVSNITGGPKEEKTTTNDKQTNTNTDGSSNSGINQNLETSSNLNNENTGLNNDTSSNTEGISEAQAREIAFNEFIKLGEEGITIDNLNVIGILRGGERYFEVSSSANSVEVNIKTGKVERINNQEV